MGQRRWTARSVAGLAAALLLAGCTGQGSQDGTAAASNTDATELASGTARADGGPTDAVASQDSPSPAVVDPGSGLPGGASAVLPEPLHASVDDWPAGTVVVDPGGGADELLVGVRIAAQRSQRRHGLMEVPSVPIGTGMWFAYGSDRTGGFWMKGTLTDLDIAWVDEDGIIVATDTMPVCPGDPCPSYEPDAAYRSALEVPAGWLADNDVEAGDTAWLVPISP